MKFTLPIKPRTKKNSQSFVTLKNGRTILLPSKPYKEFEKLCLKYIEFELGNIETIDYPINLKAWFFKDKNYKSDLVGYLQALQDALVKAKILQDDNTKIVFSTDGSRIFHDKNYPRIEVEITRATDYAEQHNTMMKTDIF